MSSPSLLKGYLYATLTAFFFGLEYIAVDYAYRHFENITPQNALFWIIAGAFCFTLPYFFRNPTQRRAVIQSARKDFFAILLLSVLTILGVFLMFWGIGESNAGVISLLERSHEIFAILLGFIFLGERFTRWEGTGMMISFLGFLFIVDLKGEIEPITSILILGGAFLFALHSLVTKKYISDINGVMLSFLRSGFIFLLLLLLFPLLGWFSFPGLVPTLFFMVVGFFSTFVSRVFYFEAHNHLPISKLNMMLLLDSLFVLSVSYFFFNDPFSLQKIIGTGLILFGLSGMILAHRSSWVNEQKSH